MTVTTRVPIRRRSPDQHEPFEHALEDARDPGGPYAVAMMDPQRSGDRDEVARDADRKGAADPECREQYAAEGRAEHAARIVGADIEGHRRAHPLRPDDLADHRAADRIVGRPRNAVDKAGERDMPHFERVAPREERQDQR